MSFHAVPRRRPELHSVRADLHPVPEFSPLQCAVELNAIRAWVGSITDKLTAEDLTHAADLVGEAYADLGAAVSHLTALANGDDPQ